MKSLILMIVLLLTVISSAGCTAMAYSHNKDYALHDVAIRSGDPEVFKAYRNGDVIGMGIDLNALDYAFYDWKTTTLQLLGGIADVGAGIGIYSLANSAFNEDNNSGSDSDSGEGNNSSGRDTIIIHTEGDGNTTDVNTGTPTIVAPVPVE